MKDLYENGGAAGVDPDLEALTDCSSTHYSRKWVRSLVFMFLERWWGYEEDVGIAWRGWQEERTTCYWGPWVGRRCVELPPS